MPVGNLKDIGALIQKLREEREITQDVFARKIGTTQSALSRIEAGEQNVSANLLSRVGKALGRDILSVARGLSIEIEGGRKLHGSVTVGSAKNSAVSLLAAALLNRGKTVLTRVPRIEEVARVIEVLLSIGVSVRWNDHTVELRPPARLRLERIDEKAAQATRSVIMLIGPLVHLLPRFSLPHAGGCRLGARTIAPHVFALEELGVRVKTRSERYDVARGRLHPADIVLYESGDTVTENAIMAAARIPGVTTLRYASANYQVQDLCRFLIKLGVKIEGIGTTTLRVHGVADINATARYSVGEDPIDAMFFIAAAAVTNSAITIRRAPIEFLELELLKLEKMGFRCKKSERYRGDNGKLALVDITTLPSRLSALPDKIEARPYPGLNIDNLPFFAVIATRARGQTLIHDWVYDDRAIYYKELDKLGAETILADPHRLFVKGPSRLHAAEVVCPPALRPAAIVLIGMLAAEGVSILRNIYSINRGYEDIIKRLERLGARIRVLREL